MKSWAPVIDEHIRLWTGRLPQYKWWPRYVYHFTDVTNAASIVKTGSILSRNACTRAGMLQNENANMEIIGRTPTASQDFVRLYFRPLTPTQYANEGIRPAHQRQNAHCPVPVFFAFDAANVLSQDSTYYSDGNMGSGRVTYDNSEEFFGRIPFDLVFHDGRFSQQERDEIVFRRNAEILVPAQLPLSSALSFIVCRSSAERQTLLALLPQAIRPLWESKVRIAAGGGFFFRRWSYVEEVVVSGEVINIRFNPATSTPGPFAASFEYEPESLELARKLGCVDTNQRSQTSAETKLRKPR